MTKLKRNIASVFLVGAIALAPFGLGGCTNPTGNGDKGNPETEQQRIARITNELMSSSIICGNRLTNGHWWTSGDENCGNHWLTGMIEVNPGENNTVNDIARMAQLIAECRLANIQRINEREAANGNPKKNITIAGNFSVQGNTFIPDVFAPSVMVTARTNPNAPTTFNHAQGTAVGAGGTLGVGHINVISRDF